MTTKHNLVVTFTATEAQKEKLKSFCLDKQDNEHIIAITQHFGNSYVLSLSFFANRPDIYIGVYSREEKKIIRDIAISDDMFDAILDRLELKYIFNKTRKSPVEIKELILAWVNYINSGFNDEKIELD